MDFLLQSRTAEMALGANGLPVTTWVKRSRGPRAKRKGPGIAGALSLNLHPG
jgi:hypothetical protein